MRYSLAAPLRHENRSGSVLDPNVFPMSFSDRDKERKISALVIKEEATGLYLFILCSPILTTLSRTPVHTAAGKSFSLA